MYLERKESGLIGTAPSAETAVKVDVANMADIIKDLVRDGKIPPEQAKGLISGYKEGKQLLRPAAIELLNLASAVLDTEDNCVQIPTPADGCKLTVVGDLHGSLNDLIEIFENQTGWPSETNQYIFNGDFVDRGNHGIEVFFVLLAFKVAYPKHVTLIRGNHEDLDINCHYGFDEECIQKYDEDMHMAICDAFALLPLCALVKKTCYVVHGGLCKEQSFTLDDVNNIQRRSYLTMMPNCLPTLAPKDNQRILDLTWSDPAREIKGWNPDYNDVRGVGCYYGPDMIKEWLDKLDVPLMIRSHELVNDQSFDVIECPGGKKLFTVFSVSNYYSPGSNTATILNMEFKNGACPIEEMQIFAWSCEVSPDDESMGSLSIGRNSAQLSELIVMNKHTLHDEHMKLLANKGVEETSGPKAYIKVNEWADLMGKSIPQLKAANMQWESLQPVLAPEVNLHDKEALFEVALIDFDDFLARYDSDLTHARRNTAEKKLKGNRGAESQQLSSLYRNYKAIATIFKFLDTNSDGHVSEEEWRKGIDVLQTDCKLEKDEIQGADQLFHIFDFDGSGKIDINEFLEGARLSRQSRQAHLKRANAELSREHKKVERKFTIKSMGWDGNTGDGSEEKNRVLRHSV